MAVLAIPVILAAAWVLVPADLPKSFSCSTDGDCAHKVQRLGCVESDKSPTGFMCWRRK